MVTINAIELVSRTMVRMNDRTFLKIPFYKIIIEFFIGTTFVTVIPKNNGRMI
jgi:hypothetical protein